jgi:hypothetical protein
MTIFLQAQLVFAALQHIIEFWHQPRSRLWSDAVSASQIGMQPNLTSRNSVRPQPRTGLVPKLYNVLESGEDKLWDELWSDAVSASQIGMQ